MFTSCGNRGRTIQIVDVTKTNIVNMVAECNNIIETNPCGITVSIYGILEGSALVHAGTWETKRLSGTIKWDIYGDWFATNCVLYYTPEHVKSGHLKLYYKYHYY